jgi:hypothetical protein
MIAFLWDTLKGAFAPKSLMEDRIQAILFAVMGSAIGWLWTRFKTWYRTSKEAAGFWAVWVVTVLFAIGLLGSRRPSTQSPFKDDPVKANVLNCIGMPWDTKATGSFPAAFVFTIRLTNPGPQTALVDWKLTTVLPTGQKYESYAAEHVGEDFNLKGDKGGTIHFSQEAYLPGRFLKSTLPQNAADEGWVGFVVKELPYDKVPLGTELRIEFETAKGIRTEIKHTWIGPITTFQ